MEKRNFIRLREEIDVAKMLECVEELEMCGHYTLGESCEPDLVDCVTSVRHILMNCSENNLCCGRVIRVGSMPKVLLEENGAEVVFTDNPRTGDVLFVGRKRKISHVVMCVEGEIFQATNRDGGFVGRMSFGEFEEFLIRNEYSSNVSEGELRSYVDYRDK